ncbi:winged helix-turn-helix transcriptional regulator [Daejeonella lutea]|uniref:Transcriptional regulator, HxlR family n=1 Tax=Daejeonella lutea TaxID=572036 RepID=A0A1T5AJH7_9SPHI|nr:helix-turn-helix domain-containing protein [Daejeonella lutea]SKB35151.1 transcriptional regulator, HxlR family [Daejeonella lutea]
MTEIKESSTRNLNRQLTLDCPVNYVMEKIGGYWKPIIIHQLMSGPKRYGELKRAIPAITEKMLIQHLKQLAADDLVVREALEVIPPSVTYSLSPAGAELSEMMEAMVKWGLKHNDNRARYDAASA